MKDNGCGKKIAITQGKGFQLKFANGWTVSVQFGWGNYCGNRHDETELAVSLELHGDDPAGECGLLELVHERKTVKRRDVFLRAPLVRDHLLPVYLEEVLDLVAVPLRIDECPKILGTDGEELSVRRESDSAASVVDSRLRWLLRRPAASRRPNAVQDGW